MKKTNGADGRTLILCFDGTSNQFDGDNTNVVKLYELLNRDEPEKQLLFYQPGIGTFTKPGILSLVTSRIARLVDMAIAWYLDEHVLGGYAFLMQNYEEGDKIVMFGFSRGAYIVRALAGMLHKVGLLPRDNFHNARLAYDMYRRDDDIGFTQSKAFKRTFSRTLEIAFMGLWDTVASVGLLMSRRLPFTASNATVRVFRHALALDERRSRFRPTLWAQTRADASSPKQSIGKTAIRSLTKLSKSLKQPTSLHCETQAVLPSRTESQATGSRSPAGLSCIQIPETLSPVTDLPETIVPDAEPQVTNGATGTTEDVDGETSAGMKHRKLTALREWLGRLIPRKSRTWPERQAEDRREKNFDATLPQSTRSRAHAASPDPDQETDFQEVWFAGGHCDVGGGNFQDSNHHQLSNVSLQWMVQEAICAEVGILFDREALADFGLDFEPKGFHASAEGDRAQSGPSAAELKDIMSPWCDALRLQPMWWILEVMPALYWYQTAEGRWHRTFMPNFGHARALPQRAMVHISVQQRMPSGYKPRAKLHDDITWVQDSAVF